MRPLPKLVPVRPAPPQVPLTDAQWAALLPFLPDPIGRPIGDLRARMDGIFHVAAHQSPWAELPAHFGKPDTVHRHFRRLAQSGLWHRLLLALSRATSTDPLRSLEFLICRAARRAVRIIGLPFITLIRRLGLLSALPGPPWLLPNPGLSEIVRAIPIPLDLHVRTAGRGSRFWVRILIRLLKCVAGRSRIPRSVRLSWP